MDSTVAISNLWSILSPYWVAMLPKLFSRNVSPLKTWNLGRYKIFDDFVFRHFDDKVIKWAYKTKQQV